MATYRHDPDLEFLRHCHRDDLDLLVSVLICDPKDGLARITETLTYDPQYKKHKPNHPRYWDAIAAEVQTFGANSFPQRCFSDIGVKYWCSFDVDTECPKTGSNAINFRDNYGLTLIVPNMLCLPETVVLYHLRKLKAGEGCQPIWVSSSHSR